MMPELIQAEASCRLGVDYPMPIVEHREAVQFARARFTELRKRRDYREAARGVMLRHGSRKGARGRSTKRSGQSDQQQCEFNFVQ
jgi:deoxyribodipyrimidine photo-lyase